MKINSYYNGEFKNRSEISIPLTDRAIFFGDGVYDAAIGRNGKVFMLWEHIDRFVSNAAALDIPLKQTSDELKRLVLQTVALSQESSYFVYFQASRFSNERIHAAPKSELSNLLITVTPFSLCDKSHRVRLVTAEDIRHTMCNVKTLNLLPSVLSSIAAADADADEAVLVRDGTVTECSHSNVHIVKNGRIITHPLDRYILPGLSRKHMLSVCERLGIPYEERAFSTKEMLDADEVFVTSSSKLALSVERINDTVYSTERNGTVEKICKTMRDDFLLYTL